MSKYIVPLLFSFLIVNPVISQKLKGKKLLKKSAKLVDKGNEREAINLLTTHFSETDEYGSEISLKVSELLEKHKLLDSATYFLSITEKLGDTKLIDQVSVNRTRLNEQIENYKIETLLAWKAFDQKKYREANTHFLQALSYDTGNYEAYLGRAEIHFLNGNSEDAISGFNNSLNKFFPTIQEKAHVYEHLAEVYLAQRKVQNVMSACDKGEGLDTANYHFLFYRGKGLYFQRLFTKADSILDCFLTHKPKHAQTWFLRGDCAYNTRNYDSAIVYLNKSLAYDSTISEAINVRARSYFELKQYKNAKKDFYAMNQLFKANFYAVNAMGMCEYYLENYEKSVSFFEKVMTLNPTNDLPK